MKESINLQEIGRIMDVSTVRTDVTFTAVSYTHLIAAEL